jgi:hypothetical protein
MRSGSWRAERWRILFTVKDDVSALRGEAHVTVTANGEGRRHIHDGIPDRYKQLYQRPPNGPISCWPYVGAEAGPRPSIGSRPCSLAMLSNKLGNLTQCRLDAGASA